MTQTKEQILERMEDIMPFTYSEKIRPYILEAMQIHADHQLILHGVVKSLNADFEVNTSVKWKSVKGHIHKNLGNDFYEIKDHNDGYIWQAHKDGIEKLN